MRRICTFMIACMLSPLAMVAQQDTNDTDFFKAIFGVDKLTIVQEFITVSDENSVAFWDTYKAYESNRKELRSERIALITEYAENYTDLSDDRLDDLCKRSIKQKNNNAKLLKKYYKKLKKTGGSKAAAQFLQVENYFLNVSRVAVSENIPFIGELNRVE